MSQNTLSGITTEDTNMDFTGNISVIDNNFTIKDNVDNTKIATFECSSITTGTTRTYTLPDLSGIIAVPDNLGDTNMSTTTRPWFAAPTLTYNWTVVGQLITIRMRQFFAACTATQNAITDVFIPAAYRPTTALYQIVPGPINNNASEIRVQVNTNGSLTYTRIDATQLGVAGQANTGWYDHSITYRYGV